MKVEERQRTCSYCGITYKTKEVFAIHWQQCPQRIKLGYIPDTNPSADVAWKKLKEMYE